MFSSLLSAPCELKLHLLQHVVFLRPPTRQPSEDAPPTSNDEVARGLVELYVPHDRRIGGIRVKLRAVQSVALLPDARDVVNFAGATPIGWEDTVLMEKIVDIGLPASKSHATVPGDDSISSAERRGRSRQARDSNNNSRLVTPVASRPSSPRISNDDAPPGYEEHASPHVSHQALPAQGGSGGGFGAIVRALSRGRPTSRPGSRSNSRAVSQTASREASPTRTATAADQPSPSAGAGVDSSSPSTTPVAAADEAADVDTISGHLSRTGLSLGRDEASGPHPHTSDRHDYFGLVPSTPNDTSPSGARGRAGPSATAAAGPSQPRSMTLSPMRGTTAASSSRGRDESRVRLMGLARRGARAPSVDTGAARSSVSSSDEQDGIFLQKGVHGFEFAFILPSDTPPYERSPYGRVRYVVKATAFGAGRAKSNLEAFRDMFPVVNPSSDGGPVPLTVLYNDMHSTVGLLSIACTSNNISVGGIFNVDIHSPVPPPDLVVYLVRVSVETTTELRTRRKGKQKVPTQRHKLFEKGWVPPRPNDPHGHGDGKKSEGLIRDPSRVGSRADDAWTVQGVARMPNDNIVRSTTISGTRASIRFSHQLLVEVVHSRAGPEVPADKRKIKVFALRQPITLPSCCVAYDAVVLPPYTPNDENSRQATMPYDLGTIGAGIGHATHNANGVPSPSGEGAPTTGDQRHRTQTSARLHGGGHELCVCGQSFDDLSERERTLMPARPYAELPLDGLSHRKIGELPETGSSNGLGNTFGNALRRSTSRSSSTSRDSRERSTSRRSMSLRRSLSRVRSPSAGSSSTVSRRGRTPSVTRVAGRGGAGSLTGSGGTGAGSSGQSGPSSSGIYANGAGERGGTSRRGSRPEALAPVSGHGSGQGIAAAANLAAPPPAYANAVEEDSGEEEDEEEGSAQRPSQGADSNASSTHTHSDSHTQDISSLSSGDAADDERREGP